MKCPKCGYENKEDASSCNLCQEVFKKDPLINEFKTDTTYNESQKPKSNFGFNFLIIIVILIAGIYFYSKSKPNNKIPIDSSKINSEFTQNVIKSGLPVLVDFWAPWCPPCRMMGPIVEELKTEYANKIVVYKVNTDENQNLASAYNIRGIPTFIFFKKGNEVDRIVGAVSKENLKSKIEQILVQ